MVNLKKAVLALSIGIDLAASASAWAFASCATCAQWDAKCSAGDQLSCNLFIANHCATCSG